MTDNAQNDLSHLNVTLTRLDATLAKMEAAQERPEHPSRGAITAALAIAGSKLTGVFGAKIGVLYSIITDKGGWPSLRFENLKTEAERGWRITRYAGVGAAVSALVGAVGFGIIGWTRGDRIKDPDDLVRKPFDSLARIFGRKPPQATPKPATRSAEAKVETLPDTQTQSTDLQSSWGERVQQPTQALIGAELR